MSVIGIAQRERRVWRVKIAESIRRSTQWIINFRIIEIAEVATAATCALWVTLLLMSRNHLALSSPSMVMLRRQGAGFVENRRDIRLASRARSWQC
jgi:hypothetical protein